MRGVCSVLGFRWLPCVLCPHTRPFPHGAGALGIGSSAMAPSL